MDSGRAARARSRTQGSASGRTQGSRGGLDAGGRDAVAASVEVDDAGRIVPTVYIRRGGEILEHAFPPHPIHEYEGEPYRSELAAVLGRLDA
jgi:hypothetical protein